MPLIWLLTQSKVLYTQLYSKIPSMSTQIKGKVALTLLRLAFKKMLLSKSCVPIYCLTPLKISL
jgi:hypothetical protein